MGYGMPPEHALNLSAFPLPCCRLLLELSELKSQPKPTSFNDPSLPYEEPKERPETKFDTGFHTPEVGISLFLALLLDPSLAFGVFYCNSGDH